QVDAVMAQMNAGEHDLLAATLYQPGYFLDNLAQRSAAEDRPHSRNDAVCAIEQAAVLHLYERALMAVKTCDAGGKGGNAERAQLLPQPVLVDDDFRDAGQPGDRVRLPRGVATHDHNGGVRIGVVEPADELPPFGVGFMRNRASIDDAQV